MNQPLAYINPQSKIADNVVIEPFTTIHKNVEIGEGTWIGSNVTIFEGARIGKNCKIFPGAVISGVPQDLKFDGEDTTVEIGDNTTIREFVTISRGTKDRWKTVVGSNCLIMAYAHVAHDCIVGNNCILGNVVQLAGHSEIGDYAIISGFSALHQFGRIGAHAFIAGGSLIRKDVPPFIKAAREPLSYAGINSVGLRRRGYTNEQVNQIQEIYRYVFMNGHNTASALEQIEIEMPSSDEKDMIVEFIKNSPRGIIKGYVK